MPNDFAETEEGVLFVADGFGPMLKWDGFTAQAEQVGVPAPTTAVTITAGSSPGGIVGAYRAYARFVDRNGLVSDLTPVSEELVVAARSGTVQAASSLSPITITSLGHGLNNASRVRVENVTGQTGANGVWDIQVIDENRFLLLGSAHSGTYRGGGTWTAGATTLTYSNVPTSDDPRVRRRQLLRNTDGQLRTFYIDIDTADLTATTFTTTKTDADLQAGTAVPVVDNEGDDLGNVHAEPLQTKAFITAHLGRMYAAGEIEYAEGAIALTFGSTTVQGIGTEWTEAARLFFLYALGADRHYEIEAVDTVNQTLTLTEPYSGSTDAYANYALTPPPGTEDIVQFSEAGLPESWPILNAVALRKDGDKISGLMSHRSMLYILKRKHAYRLTVGEDATRDGDIYLAASRGCINHRCFALVEGAAYMLDEQGVHVFQKAGAENGSVSTPIQTLLEIRPERAIKHRINFAASRYFHSVVDPATETIRWFVSMTGQYLPRHCLAYHYTLDRWWIEEYAVPIGASALGKLARQAGLSTWGVGREQVFLGSQHRRVLAWGADLLDGCNSKNHTTGAVASAGVRTLTGEEAFASDAVGCPVVIRSGRGKGQVRLVTAVSGATLSVKRPWLVRPDTTSVYQLGGIVWSYRTGWYRWADEESQNERRIELVFEPADGERLSLKRYRDRSDAPVEMGMTSNADGVRSTKGESELEIDLGRETGFVQTRLSGSKELYTHGPRLVSVGLGGVGGPQPTRVYQITLDGVSARGR